MTIGKYRLSKATQNTEKIKADLEIEVPAELGIPFKGTKEQVEVPRRDGFVFARIRGSMSEVVQAFNDKVSLVYGLPVILIRDRVDKGRWRVKGRDIGRYGSWGSSDLPFHGATHSFNPDAPGADLAWIYNRQIMPWAVLPSGSSGGPNVIVQEGINYYNGQFTYNGITGTQDIVPTYLPTGSNKARMVLVYSEFGGNPLLVGGDEFDASITGTGQLIQYVPSIPIANAQAQAAIRIVSGTTKLLWDNIYDVRSFAGSAGTIPTGTVGHGIQDEGNPLTSRPSLNFVGAGLVAYDDAVNNRTNVSGSFSIDKSLNDLIDVAITSTVSGQFLRFNGTEWVNTNGLVQDFALNDLTDVTLTSSVSGQFLRYNGIEWINTSSLAANLALDDLTDVNAPTPNTGDTLKWVGGEWINGTPSSSPISWQRTLVVDQGGNGQFLTVAEACDYGQTVTPKNGDNPWTVYIMPGIYYESEQINVPSYMHLVGAFTPGYLYESPVRLHLTLTTGTALTLNDGSGLVNLDVVYEDTPAGIFSVVGFAPTGFINSAFVVQCSFDFDTGTGFDFAGFKLDRSAVDLYMRDVIVQHNITPYDAYDTAIHLYSSSTRLFLFNSRVFAISSDDQFVLTIGNSGTTANAYLYNSYLEGKSWAYNSSTLHLSNTGFTDLDIVPATVFDGNNNATYLQGYYLNPAIPAGLDILQFDSFTNQWHPAVLPTYSLNSLTDVLLSSSVSGQFLRFNGVNWINTSGIISGSFFASLDDLTDVIITNPTSGSFLRFDGTNWVNISGSFALNDLSDVSTINPIASGSYLRYNGSEWIDVSGTTAGGVTSLNDLSDVSINNLTSGNAFAYNGSDWVNITGSHQLYPPTWKFDLDTPKTVFDVPDDEFLLSSLDAKWTVLSGTAGSVNLFSTGTSLRVYDLVTRPSWIGIQISSLGFFEMRQDYALPDGKSIILCISPSPLSDASIANNELWTGFCLNDSDTNFSAGNYTQLFMIFDSNVMQAQLLADGASIGISYNAGTLPAGSKIYLRIARNNLDYHGFFSKDGTNWTPLGKKTAAGAYNNIWIVCQSRAAFATPNPIQMIDWIRLGNNTLDPW